MIFVKDLATMIQTSKLVQKDSLYKLALLPQCQYLARLVATPMLCFITAL